MESNPPGTDELIEQQGTHPISSASRNSGTLDCFLLMINFLVNPGTIITAAMAVAAGLSFTTTLVVFTSAVFFGIAAFLVMARIGVDYGLTGQMACRAALGIRGGCWFTSPLRAMCSIYWFAFQTLAGSFALSAILKECFSVDLPLPVIGLVFASLQVLVAAIGIKWLRGLFAWALPLKLLSLFFILFMVVRLPDMPEVDLQIPINENWLLAIIWFNASFGGMLTIITDAADFTRYTRSVKALWIGGLTGSLLGVVLGAGMGAYIMALLGGEASQLFNSILQHVPGFWMALAIMLLIVLDNWTINVINLYSGGLSLCHTLEKLGRFRCTLLVSIPSVLLSCFPQIVEQYVEIAEAAGMLFSAIAGILLVDYLSRRWQLDVPSLYRKEGPYWYQHGFKISSMLLILMTVLSGSLLPDGWPIPMIVLFMAGAGYLILNRYLSNSKVLRYLDGQIDGQIDGKVDGQTG